MAYAISKLQDERVRRALEEIVSADNCNYERDTMRSQGMFDRAREALGWPSRKQREGFLTRLEETKHE